MMEHCLLPEPSPPCLTYIYFVMNCQRHQTITQVVNFYIQLQFQLVSSEITLGIVCNHSIFVCKSEVRTVVATCDAVTVSHDYSEKSEKYFDILSSFLAGMFIHINGLLCLTSYRTYGRNEGQHINITCQKNIWERRRSTHQYYVSKEHMGETTVNTSILRVKRTYGRDDGQHINITCQKKLREN